MIIMQVIRMTKDSFLLLLQTTFSKTEESLKQTTSHLQIIKKNSYKYHLYKEKSTRSPSAFPHPKTNDKPPHAPSQSPPSSVLPVRIFQWRICSAF